MSLLWIAKLLFFFTFKKIVFSIILWAFLGQAFLISAALASNNAMVYVSPVYSLGLRLPRSKPWDRSLSASLYCERWFQEAPVGRWEGVEGSQHRLHYPAGCCWWWLAFSPAEELGEIVKHMARAKRLGYLSSGWGCRDSGKVLLSWCAMVVSVRTWARALCTPAPARYPFLDGEAGLQRSCCSYTET